MSRINNPEFLKLHLPLNNHTEDISGHGNDGVPTSLSYEDGPFGLSVGDFGGSSDVTYTEVAGITRFAWWEDDVTFRYYDGTNYFTNGILSGSFTIRVTTTQVGVGYTGQIWNVRLYSIDLIQEEILEIYNSEKISPKLRRIPQPFNTLPDILDESLVGSWLNIKTVNSGRDYSNAGNDGVENNGLAHQTPGVLSPNTGSITLTNAITFTDADVLTALVTIQTTNNGNGSSTRIKHPYISDNTSGLVIAFGIEGGFIGVLTWTGAVWAKLTGSIAVGDGAFHRLAWRVNGNQTIDMWVDGVLDVEAGAFIKPSSNGIKNLFDGRSSFVDGSGRNFEIYDEAKSDAFILADYVKSVPDSSLLLHLLGGDADLSRFDRALVNNGVIVGGRDMVFSSFTLTWPTVTTITFQMFWFTDASNEWAHWASDGSTNYKNGVVTVDSLPVTILVTGLPAAAYTISNLKIFSEVKGAAYVLSNYLDTRKYY